MKKGAAQATSTHQQHFQGREEPVGEDGLPF
jgi:hypothetical protein